MRLQALLTGPLDLVTTQADMDINERITLATGTGNNQADQAFSDQYTISASSTQVVDLGAAVSNINQTLVFSKVKAIFLKLAAGASDQSTVSLAPNGTEGFADWLAGTTPALKVGPGGILLVTHPKEGWAVAEDTDDKLLITNDDSTNAATVDIVVIGVATAS